MLLEQAGEYAFADTDLGPVVPGSIVKARAGRIAAKWGDRNCLWRQTRCKHHRHHAPGENDTQWVQGPVAADAWAPPTTGRH